MFEKKDIIQVYCKHKNLKKEQSKERTSAIFGYIYREQNKRIVSVCLGITRIVLAEQLAITSQQQEKVKFQAHKA